MAEREMGLERLHEDRQRVSEGETGEDGKRKRKRKRKELSLVALLYPPLWLQMSYKKAIL